MSILLSPANENDVKRLATHRYQPTGSLLTNSLDMGKLILGKDVKIFKNYINQVEMDI